MGLWIKTKGVEMSRRRGQRYVVELVAEFYREGKERPLSSVQQEELVLKLRFGLGLDQVFGPRVAREIRRDVKFPLSPAPREVEREREPPAPEPVPPPRAQVEHRAAAMGVTAGKIGQWLRR